MIIQWFNSCASISFLFFYKLYGTFYVCWPHSPEMLVLTIVHQFLFNHIFLNIIHEHFSSIRHPYQCKIVYQTCQTFPLDIFVNLSEYKIYLCESCRAKYSVFMRYFKAKRIKTQYLKVLIRLLCSGLSNNLDSFLDCDWQCFAHVARLYQAQ